MASYTNDLRYRVTTLRLWGSDQFDGFQFVYRHFLTNDEREGAVVTTTRVAKGTPSTAEIQLVDGESLVGFTSISTPLAPEPAGKQPAQTTITAVMVVTSSGRRLCVGSVPDGAAGADINPLYVEIRGLQDARSPSHGSFTGVVPTTIAYPTPEEVEALVADVVEASKVKWAYVNECEQLTARLLQIHTLIKSVLGRGVLVPVDVLVEFVDIVKSSTDIITSCGTSYGIGYMYPRGSSINSYNARLAELETYVQRQIPLSELACLRGGDAVAILETKRVAQMIQQSLDSAQVQLAAELCAKHGQYLTRFHGRLVQAVATSLAETDDLCALIPRVVDAGGTKPAQSRLGPAARAGGQEWLVVKAALDPFYESTPPALFGQATENERGNPLEYRSAQRQQRHDKLQTILGTVDNTKDAQDMQHLLQRIKDKEDFQLGMLMLAMQEDVVTADQLGALVPKITSVYDLPLFFSQAKSELEKPTIEPSKRSSRPLSALKQATRLGYLTKAESMQFKLVAVQVNMQSAQRVQAWQKTFCELQCRVTRLDDHLHALERNVSDLRAALQRKEDTELRRRRCRRGMALVTSMLSMFGGQILAAIHDAMFDLPDACDVLFAQVKEHAKSVDGTLALEVADNHLGFGLQDGKKWVEGIISWGETTGFRAEILHALKDTNVSPQEFFALTNEAIVLSEAQPKTVFGERVDYDHGAIRVFPFHKAVHTSGGKLHEFKRLENALQDTMADPCARMRVTLTRVYDDDTTESKPMEINASEFARYLGYIDIAEHLRKTCDASKHRKWKFWRRTAFAG